VFPRVVVLAVVALLAAACSRDPDAASTGPAPVPVVVARAVQRPVPVQVRAIGHAAPTDTVTVRSRVDGILREVHFREGQDVEQGALLFSLDRRQLEAAVRQAEANLARSQAQLANARKDAARYAELVRQGFVAQQQYDQLRTTVATLEATVRADRAAVASARVELGYGAVRAPLSGRTGAQLVHPGDVIRANDTPMLVINRIRPIEVTFAVPEQHLPEIQRRQAERPLAVEAVEPTRGEPLGEGTLTFVDNRVDPATGTIQLKGTFPNEQARLWPGQFVDVLLTLRVDPAAVVVPTAAVQTGQDGRYVFVVTPDQTVQSRPVVVAREAARETVIAQGVAAGETVVVEGQLRLLPGARVEVRSVTEAPAAAGPADGGSASPAAAPAPAAPAPSPPPAPPAASGR
jgi:multidrug efflux system membrane fusion protein